MSARNEGKKITPRTFEAQLHEALKFFGDDLPSTDEEIRVFINSIGETKVELPANIANAADLFKDIVSKNSKITTDSVSLMSMAAHGQSECHLPKDIEAQLKIDLTSGKRVKPRGGNERSKKERD
jgi:hypothetical protein